MNPRVGRTTPRSRLSRAGLITLSGCSALLLTVGAGCSSSDTVAGTDTASVTSSPSASDSSTPTPELSTTSSAPSPTTTTSASRSPSTEPSPSASTSSPSTTGVACPPKSSLLGEDLERLPTSEKVVALTFDAGANDDAVAPILATLSEKDVVGTFFLTGDFVKQYPSAAREIAARYPVGNHSMTHPELTKKSSAQMRTELNDAEQAIKEVTGKDPRPYFRFPFGDVNSRTIEVANSLCYIPFRWTADSLGWKGTSGGMTAKKVRQRALDKLQPGEIVLMHLGSNPQDHSTLDADALPGMIDQMRAAGYSFVTLEKALN